MSALLTIWSKQSAAVIPNNAGHFAEDDLALCSLVLRTGGRLGSTAGEMTITDGSRLTWSGHNRGLILPPSHRDLSGCECECDWMCEFVCMRGSVSVNV